MSNDDFLPMYYFHCCHFNFNFFLPFEETFPSKSKQSEEQSTDFDLAVETSDAKIWRTKIAFGVKMCFTVLIINNLLYFLSFNKYSVGLIRQFFSCFRNSRLQSRIYCWLCQPQSERCMSSDFYGNGHCVSQVKSGQDRAVKNPHS